MNKMQILYCLKLVLEIIPRVIRKMWRNIIFDNHTNECTVKILVEYFLFNSIQLNIS